MRRACLAIGVMAALASSWPGRASPPPASGASQPARVDIAAYVREASQRFGIPERWIEAVIRVESAGRLRAISPAGAMGLMQLMPGTWARQRARFGLGADPFDPRDNILAGTSYLREMYDRYGLEGFLAAYNAGPGRYEAWLAGQRALPLETRRYVEAIGALLQQPPGRAVAPAAQLTLPSTGGQQRIPGAPAQVETAISERRPVNPFARTAPSAHDLFVPVSTASGQ